MINRRNILQGMAAGVALGFTSLGKSAQGSERSGLPKRVIFFLQNQGFDPATGVHAFQSKITLSDVIWRNRYGGCET